MKTLSKDGKCELVEKQMPTSKPCEGCFYDKKFVVCAASSSDVAHCTDKDFNHEGTHIFKEIAQCQNTTA